jgi:FAD/FMN-containing dehydrogenase
LIAAGLSNRVLLATSPDYESRVQSWWAANNRLHPWCFVLPYNTQELSTAVQALANAGSGAGDWHIAVRSGGHSYAGSNSITNGITIDLSMMNSSSYNPVTKLASIEPGGKWKNVYADLLRTANVTVTGGRDGDVGVGGFLLGGGNSFYTARTGWGCDTVVNFEVVLANGTIVNANATENPDLWKALKGGSLNFGIVSRFDVEALPAVDLAYGQRVILGNYTDQVIDAMVNFTNAQETQADDALVSLWMHDQAISDEIVIVNLKANTRGNLNTTSFDAINNISALQDSWSHTSMATAANSSQLTSGTKYAPFALLPPNKLLLTTH